MPEVSRFYGIVIEIFYGDHNPPHFHAEYGEYEVLVNGAVQRTVCSRCSHARRRGVKHLDKAKSLEKAKGLR